MIQVLRSDQGPAYETSRTKLLAEILEEIRFNQNSKSSISKIVDHKGCLMVYWESLPNDFEKKQISDIWGIFGEDYIIHFLTHSTQI
jgi:hypothetical protein